MFHDPVFAYVNALRNANGINIPQMTIFYFYAPRDDFSSLQNKINAKYIGWIYIFFSYEVEPGLKQTKSASVETSVPFPRFLTIQLLDLFYIY